MLRVREWFEASHTVHVQYVYIQLYSLVNVRNYLYMLLAYFFLPSLIKTRTLFINDVGLFIQIPKIPFPFLDPIPIPQNPSEVHLTTYLNLIKSNTTSTEPAIQANVRGLGTVHWLSSHVGQLQCRCIAEYLTVHRIHPRQVSCLVAQLVESIGNVEVAGSSPIQGSMQRLTLFYSHARAGKYH